MRIRRGESIVGVGFFYSSSLECGLTMGFAMI